jgi:hypothetical protein
MMEFFEFRLPRKRKSLEHLNENQSPGNTLYHGISKLDIVRYIGSWVGIVKLACY